MTRGQWTLLGLLVVQAALIAVLRQPASAGFSETRPLVDGLDPAAIARIEVGSTGEKLALRRDGETWAIVSAGDYPADGAKVRDLLDKIKSATVRSPVVTSDKYHESLEVTEEKAQARIRLYRADSETPVADLLLGKNAMGGGAHVRLAGDDEVFDVADLSPWSLRPQTSTWMQRTIVDIPPETVRRISVSSSNGSFELERVEDEWLVAAPEEQKGRSCAKEKVDPIVRAAASLNAADIGGKLDPPAQGLGDDATTITLTHDEGSVTVRIGSTVPDRSGHVYVTRDGFPFAVTQWASSLDSVTKATLAELLQ
jgi:hypothetical protein